MNFWKMNGAGNDFIILDGRKEKIDPVKASGLAKILCERHLSIGADGLMLVLPAEMPGADYQMLFFNADGSMGEMCGNGARCICRYGFENGYAGKLQRVQTTAGLVTGVRIDEKNYRIRLNDPSVIDLKRKVAVEEENYFCAYVELGNPGIPHGVLELPDRYKDAVHRLLHQTKQEAADTETLGKLRELGRKLRFSSAFPKGANINFYMLTGENKADILTFERGVEDFTYACGTGTGSTALVLSRMGFTGKTGVQINNRGGRLTVDVEEDGLYLTGPTNVVAAGEIRDDKITVRQLRSERKDTT